MKDIKLMLAVLLLGLGVLTVLGASQDENALWDLGSADDYLSSGPVYHSGPYYYPNSDLSLGTQQFLNNYPSYTPLGYSSSPGYNQNYNLGYNPAYKPVVLGNNYTSNYMQGYYNPYAYYYDPQAALDYAVANHANQKYLNNYYNTYYWNYGY